LGFLRMWLKGHGSAHARTCSCIRAWTSGHMQILTRQASMLSNQCVAVAIQSGITLTEEVQQHSTIEHQPKTSKDVSKFFRTFHAARRRLEHQTSVIPSWSMIRGKRAVPSQRTRRRLCGDRLKNQDALRVQT